MLRDDTRRVHARRGIVEIVRYDRSGKWYREIDGMSRCRISIAQAVREAMQPGTEVFARLPGGGRFDALMLLEVSTPRPKEDR